MLTITHVTKFYGGIHRALNDVNLQIPRGEIVGLFGENGAGKSTLMKCILGFHGYRGEITLDQKKIGPKNIENLSFATSEHSFFPNMTAHEHREFYREHFPAFRNDRFELLMQFFALPYHKPARSFSTGQKNQLEVILALSQGADYILMDEPFAGNDIFFREDFYKVLLALLEPNETLILSTHLLEEVKDFISRAILIRKGEVIADVATSDMEDQGEDLIAFIKKAYGYQSDRVMRTMAKLQGGDEDA